MALKGVKGLVPRWAGWKSGRGKIQGKHVRQVGPLRSGAVHSIKGRAQELLALARKLAETPTLTWVEANNAVYGPGGPFVRLFATASDRVAFAKTEESRRIDHMIDSLPEPPVGAQRREYSGKFNVRLATRLPRRKFI